MTTDAIEELEDARDRAAYTNAVEALKVIIADKNGQVFFKYLFKEFMVGKMPPLGLEPDDLREQMGLYRAGHSIFELVSAANVNMAGHLLAQKEREENEFAKFVREQASKAAGE